MGFGHYLSFMPPITAPDSSPASPVWAGGGTRMCVTDGDVCEVLERVCVREADSECHSWKL